MYLQEFPRSTSKAVVVFDFLSYWLLQKVVRDTFLDNGNGGLNKIHIFARKQKLRFGGETHISLVFMQTTPSAYLDIF